MQPHESSSGPDHPNREARKVPLDAFAGGGGMGGQDVVRETRAQSLDRLEHERDSLASAFRAYCEMEGLEFRSRQRGGVEGRPLDGDETSRFVHNWQHANEMFRACLAPGSTANLDGLAGSFDGGQWAFLFSTVDVGRGAFVVPAWQPLSERPNSQTSLTSGLSLVGEPYEALRHGAGLVAVVESKHWHHGNLKLFFGQDAFREANEHAQEIARVVTAKREENPGSPVAFIPGASLLVAGLLWQINKNAQEDARMQALFDGGRPEEQPLDIMLGVSRLRAISDNLRDRGTCDYEVGVVLMAIDPQVRPTAGTMLSRGPVREHVETLRVGCDSFGFLETTVRSARDTEFSFGGA